MPSINELERWLTAGQVASRLGYTRQHILNLANNKRIRAVHVGSSYADGRGVWVYDPDSVSEYAKKMGKD